MLKRKQSYFLMYQKNHTRRVQEYNHTLCAESVLRNSHRCRKKEKKSSKELKFGKESPFLKSEYPINQKNICLEALNQSLSDFTD